MFKYRRLTSTRHVARMDECKNGFKILTGKPIEKIFLERARRKWEDNIGIDIN